MSGFLIDANSLITPYREYYRFDLVPGFWKALEKQFSNGSIAILDVVQEEIKSGKDKLSAWLQGVKMSHVVDIENPDIFRKYREILSYVQNAGFYKAEALMEWSQFDVADPWLIAAASVRSLTIVTFEKPNNSLSVKQPSRTAKIPDVARHFRVQYCDLFEMMSCLNMAI